MAKTGKPAKTARTDRDARKAKSRRASSARPIESLAKIPSMTALLNAAVERREFAAVPRAVLTGILRDAVTALRTSIREGTAEVSNCEMVALLAVAADRLGERRARRLVRVINATGVVLHTGLGRSVLPDEAVQRLSTVAGGYCNLEIDLASGERGLRGGYVEELIRELTGAESALVVNNNAAATMLALRALAKGREVIVSRGQLIEIGGSYRLPEVMSAGGATLREVGTTNKTHLRDYKSAIGDATGLVMHVHTSNYRVVGFSETPRIEKLVELAHRHDIPVFDDLGSGALLDDDIWKASNEPTVRASLAAGADLIAFSGDKLLGGPQAGILVGRREIVDRLRKDPMARALRVGKLTMAALEAVLELYQDPIEARKRIPFLRSLSEPVASLMTRAGKLASMLSEAAPLQTFSVARSESYAGGGSLPAWPFPTATVRWTPKAQSVDATARALRLGEPAVLPRINEGAIVFDLRTISDDEFSALADAVRRLVRS